MSKFTKEMVDDYANKLLFKLTPEENKMVLDEFDIIDKTINIINEIDGIEKLEPMTHALDDFENDFRDDVADASIPVKEALKNAGAVEGREIEVPKVVD